MTEKIYDYPLSFNGDLTLLELVDIVEHLDDWHLSIFLDTMVYDAGTDKILIVAQGRDLVDAQAIVDMIDGVEIDEETVREWLSDENGRWEQTLKADRRLVRETREVVE